jgi:hypothetical protein
MEEEVLSVGKKGVLEGAELHCLHQKGLLSLVMGWELARTVISPLQKMCQVHFSSFFLIFDLPPRSLCVCYACGIERGLLSDLEACKPFLLPAVCKVLLSYVCLAGIAAPPLLFRPCSHSNHDDSGL